jgi:BMFP domain-containing protein YqiC
MALQCETVKSIVWQCPALASVSGQTACIHAPKTLTQLYPAVAGNRSVSTRTDGAREIIMTTGPNRIMDEFAKLMTDAAGAAQGVRREIETAFNAQAERWLNSMDIVKREEFEAVREMAIKARDENEVLLARIEALEAKLAAKGE